MHTLFCLFLEHCADNPEASSDLDLYKPQSSSNSGLVEGVAVSVVMLVIAAVCIVVLVILWRYIGISILGYVNINVAGCTNAYAHTSRFEVENFVCFSEIECLKQSHM